MLLQEQIKRQAETSLGEASCAAMAARATIGKKPATGLALIEILSARRLARKQHRHAKHSHRPKHQSHNAPHGLPQDALAMPGKTVKITAALRTVCRGRPLERSIEAQRSLHGMARCRKLTGGE